MGSFRLTSPRLRDPCASTTAPARAGDAFPGLRKSLSGRDAAYISWFGPIGIRYNLLRDFLARPHP
jgi:hypothetical protein